MGVCDADGSMYSTRNSFEDEVWCIQHRK